MIKSTYNESRFKVLVVDDQYGRPGLERQNFLSRLGRDESSFLFSTGQSEDGHNVPEVTLNLVEQLWDHPSQHRLSLVLLDVRFVDSQDPQDKRFGFKILRALRERFGRSLPIVMLTAESGTNPDANAASANGFIPKENLSSEGFEAQLFRNGVFPDTTGRLVGSAHSFLLALRELRRIVKSGVKELLLLGEIGTGKTQLAQYFHSISERSTGPFKSWPARLTIPDIQRFELFGNWEGSFTDGPKANLPGLAEMAANGTLFIDEIAELHPAVQPDLLEYAQRSDRDKLRRIKRMGIYPRNSKRNLNLVGKYNENEDRVLVDTFLITATNAPLDDPEWRKTSGFRDALLSRLGQRIVVPSLRERKEDIIPLFLALFKRASNDRDVTLTEDAQSLLTNHDWKNGNIRELGDIARSVTTLVGPEFCEIHAHHIEEALAQKRKTVELPSDSALTTPHLPAMSTQSEKEDGWGANVVSTRLVELEVQTNFGKAEILRNAVLETRRQDRIGTLSDIFKHATGKQYPATDVKREVKDILIPWFAPNARQIARWTVNNRYGELADRIRKDSVLCVLYNYSTDEMTWEEASVRLAEVLSGRQGSSEK